MSQEIKTYQLPGNESSAEVHKPFGNKHYYALVRIDGRYPGANQIAHDIGRREHIHLLKGEVQVTVNTVAHLLQVGTTRMIEDGDYYQLTGKGKMVVFVEDKKGGATQIEELPTENQERDSGPMHAFEFDGRLQPVSFVETTRVTTGVECDVYTFEGDISKDLGVIRIEPGFKTPLQRVLKGDRTIEGYLSGKGRLIVTKSDNTQREYPVSNNTPKPFTVTVAVGETMQWQADADSLLVAYEICSPPYEDGRFENM
jgi:hypothetical protein